MSNHEVFHKFRIPKYQGYGKCENKGLLSGISANSWFTPRGISEKANKSMTPYGPVTDEIRQYLQERAQSAGAMFGRRIYDSDKQTLKTDECLQGIRIFLKKNEISSSFNETLCFKKKSNSSPNILNGQSKPLHYRPHTSYERFRLTNPNTESLQPTVEGIKLGNKMQIPEKNCLLCQEEQQNIKTTQNFKIANYHPKLFNEQADKKISIQTFADDKTKCNVASLRKRIQSAPCHLESRKSHAKANIVGSNSQVSVKAIQNENDSFPLYWRTRSNHHRKLYKQEVDIEGKNHETSTGSMLKPLLFKEQFVFKHSAGCPYKCKRCFRACLASQDYIENLSSTKITRKRQVKPKHYHKKIVEMALAKSQPVNKFIKDIETNKKSMQ